MDYIDIEILRLLLNNCRLPYRVIGDRVKLSGQSIRRRIHRLVDNSVIISFISRGGKCGTKLEEFVGILSFAERVNPNIVMDALLALPSIFCTVFCDSHLIFFRGCIEGSCGIKETLMAIWNINGVEAVSVYLVPDFAYTLKKYKSKFCQLIPHLIESPRIRYTDLSRRTGFNVKTVRRYIINLLEEDLIRFSIEYNLSAWRGVGSIIRAKPTTNSWPHDSTYSSLIDAVEPIRFRTTQSATQSIVFLECWANNLSTINRINDKLKRIPKMVSDMWIARKWKYTIDPRITKLLEMVYQKSK